MQNLTAVIKMAVVAVIVLPALTIVLAPMTVPAGVTTQCLAHPRANMDVADENDRDALKYYRTASEQWRRRRALSATDYAQPDMAVTQAQGRVIVRFVISSAGPAMEVCSRIDATPPRFSAAADSSRRNLCK
jgi:hypothetical protein